MREKTVEASEALWKQGATPTDRVPIFFQSDCLDEYENGEIACHRRGEFLFGLLDEGELDYYYYTHPDQPRHWTVKKGDGFFINSRVLHGCRQNISGTRLFSFGMAPSFFVSPIFGKLYQNAIAPVIHSRVMGTLFPCVEADSQGMLRLFEEFRALCQEDRDYEFHAVQLVCQIWRALLNHVDFREPLESMLFTDPHRAGRIEAMVHFIKTHYNQPITVSDVAQAGNVSRRECFRCFRELRGQTPTEFLIQYRLSMASYLLATTHQSIAAIGKSCGFESTSYFDSLFKKRFGMTPRQFRK